jgi:hypothetical protein
MLHLSGWQSQVLCAVIRKRKHELLIVYVVPITSEQLEVSSSAFIILRDTKDDCLT